MYSKENKLLIIKDKKTGLTYEDLSKKYGIPRSSIQYIVDNYANWIRNVVQRKNDQEI